MLELYVFDRNLSGYYASVGKIGDSFSIRLDEIDFSNVEGGFGVFGSYISQKLAIAFDEEYINSFGYILHSRRIRARDLSLKLGVAAVVGNFALYEQSTSPLLSFSLNETCG